MTEPKHIISPKGIIHIVDRVMIDESSRQVYTTLCDRVDYSKDFFAGHWYYYPVTEKAVTCRKCLGKSINRMDQLAGLARKCLDMEIRFWGLIKDCKYFVENRVFAPVSHSYININICKHRRRLGTEKNPKLCNLVDCPLKYER